MNSTERRIFYDAIVCAWREMRMSGSGLEDNLKLKFLSDHNIVHFTVLMQPDDNLINFLKSYRKYFEIVAQAGQGRKHERKTQ